MQNDPDLLRVIGDQFSVEDQKHIFAEMNMMKDFFEKVGGTDDSDSQKMTGGHQEDAAAAGSYPIGLSPYDPLQPIVDMDPIFYDQGPNPENLKEMIKAYDDFINPTKITTSTTPPPGDDADFDGFWKAIQYSVGMEQLLICLLAGFICGWLFAQCKCCRRGRRGTNNPNNVLPRGNRVNPQLHPEQNPNPIHNEIPIGIRNHEEVLMIQQDTPHPHNPQTHNLPFHPQSQPPEIDRTRGVLSNSEQTMIQLQNENNNEDNSAAQGNQGEEPRQITQTLSKLFPILPNMGSLHKILSHATIHAPHHPHLSMALPRTGTNETIYPRLEQV